MVYPHRRERAPESDLRRYLEEARAILSQAPPAATGRLTTPLTEPRVSPDFEELLWFDLPDICLR
jgi:hypothetical protein